MSTFEWNGDRIQAAIRDSGQAALSDGAEFLLETANRKVPLEYGDLMRSGTVVSDGTEAAVGYTSVYAARQHEELDWKHNDGREAKWLENALNNNQDLILDVIADRLKGAIG